MPAPLPSSGRTTPPAPCEGLAAWADAIGVVARANGAVTCSAMEYPFAARASRRQLLRGGAVYAETANCRDWNARSLTLPALRPTDVWGMARRCLPAAWADVELPQEDGTSVEIGGRSGRTVVSSDRWGWRIDGCLSDVFVFELYPDTIVHTRSRC